MSKESKKVELTDLQSLQGVISPVGTANTIHHDEVCELTPRIGYIGLHVPGLLPLKQLSK